MIDSKDWHSIYLWISTIIQIGDAMFLLLLSRSYGIIGQKSLLPACFYLLFIGTNPLLFDNLTGSVLVVLTIACFFCLFATYQNPLPQLHACNIAVLISLGSLYWFPLLLFPPLFWYGIYLLKSFNFKSFFAYFLGLFGVYFFFFL